MYYGGSKKGRKLSFKTRQKMSKSHKGAKNYNFGKIMPPEQRRKISIAHKGFKHAEESKRKMSKARKGSKNSQWKGGKIKHHGYIFIHKPEHPFCDNQNYVKRSRLVMEKKLGRYLTPKEVVHHKNDIKDDDRPENLRLFANNSEHRKFHSPKGIRFHKNLT